ncbi:MAG: DUF167 family protein, partial [Candidatus Methanofastidiosia archaeon]
LSDGVRIPERGILDVSVPGNISFAFVITMFEEAISEGSGGVYVVIEVVPNSKEFSISWDKWRRRIKLKIRAKPQKGKANEEILSFFGNVGRAKIVSGAHGKDKTIFVEAKKEHITSLLANQKVNK